MSARRAVDLATVLVARDLRASYGTALIGLVWAPITAVVQVAVLSFLFLRVVPLDVPDYAVFVYTGVAAWQLLSGALVRSTEAFTGNRDLVRRPGFPPIVLPVVTVAGAACAYALSVPVLLVAVAWSGRLAPSAFALPLVVLVGALLVTGPAMVIATLTARFRDIRHVVGAAVAVLFYLTPVFYGVDQIPERYRWVADANPLALAVRMHREVLYDGEWPDPGHLATCVAIGLVLLAAGTALHVRSSAHLADDL